MKKTKRTEPFDWSRWPAREGVYKVFLGDPDAYTTFGKGITKEELANSLAMYDRITALEQKKKLFYNAFIYSVLSIPVFILVYNVFIQHLLKL